MEGYGEMRGKGGRGKGKGERGDEFFPSAQCPMLHAPCPMPHAQCPITINLAV